MATSVDPSKTFRARALYEWKSKNAADLQFAAGDIISVTDKINDDWWFGALNGASGKFPRNRVEAIADAKARP